MVYLPLDIVIDIVLDIVLVGGILGIPTPLKNMSSSMGRIIPYIMENKKCSKAPTKYDLLDNGCPIFV